MSWTEIVLEVPRQQAELVSDALIEAGALSVSVEDANEKVESACTKLLANQIMESYTFSLEQE